MIVEQTSNRCTRMLTVRQPHPIFLLILCRCVLPMRLTAQGAMLAALAAGVLLLVRDSPSGGGFEIVVPAATGTPDIRLKVYITGAVVNPGVYPARQGERLARLVESAGGATLEADLAAVNLAVRLKDEDHWHIPKVGESSPPPPLQGVGGAGKIDINSATVEELKNLPGIGDVKAQSIVRYREVNGPFSQVEDLLDIQGIGPATLDSLRDLVEAR